MKTPVSLGWEDGVMSINHWETGEVLWKTKGKLSHYDAIRMAYDVIRSLGYHEVDTDR